MHEERNVKEKMEDYGEKEVKGEKKGVDSKCMMVIITCEGQKDCGC